MLVTIVTGIDTGYNTFVKKNRKKYRKSNLGVIHYLLARALNSSREVRKAKIKFIRLALRLKNIGLFVCTKTPGKEGKMELQTSKVDLLLDVDQKPELVPGLLLSLQHVFAMFGATVLVP